MGIAQLISDDLQSAGFVTYTVTKPVKDLSLYVTGAAESAYPSGITNTVLHNDVGINVKSFNQKEPLEIKLTPSTGSPTKDQVLWELINGHQFNFRHYRNFIDDVLTSYPSPNSVLNQSSAQKSNTRNLSSFPYEDDTNGDLKVADSKRLPFNRTEAYSLLKYATERYVDYVFDLQSYVENGYPKEKTALEDYLGPNNIIPYYDLVKSKIKEYFRNDNDQKGLLKSNADTTLVELIWNYWYERRHGWPNNACNCKKVSKY